MRFLPLLILSGCIPISASEYAGGARDAGAAGLDATDEPASEELDAAVEEEPDAADVLDGEEPSSLDDAGDAGPEPSLDAGALRPEVSCSTPGVFCEKFERYPTCPNVPGPNWDVCEHLRDPIGPTREELADDAGFALRSRISADAGVRSQRLVRGVPLDADYFEASFWMITDPSENTRFVWLKLEQEASEGAEGDVPGVSLVGTDGRMGVVVETQQSARAGDLYHHESDLGPWPEGWIHVLVQVDLVKPSVHVEYHDDSFGPPSPWDLAGFDLNMVALGRQSLALGLYSENAGAVQMLFDDLQAYASKGGEVIPLL